MKKRTHRLSINSRAQLKFYRAVCLECVWSGKEYTVMQPATGEGVRHHRRNPDHWVTVRESRPVHQFKPADNYLPGLAPDTSPELDKPPF